MARRGSGYALPPAYKKVVPKKILVGNVNETYNMWETQLFYIR